MPPASVVHKRFEQHLRKGEATYITRRQKAAYCYDAMYVQSALPSSPNSEKCELATETKYREIKLPAFIFCRGDIFQPDRREDGCHTDARDDTKLYASLVC